MKISTEISVQVIRRTVGSFLLTVVKRLFDIPDEAPMNDIQSSVGGIHFDVYQVYINHNEVHVVSQIDKEAFGYFKVHFDGFTTCKENYEIAVIPGDTLDIAMLIREDRED